MGQQETQMGWIVISPKGKIMPHSFSTSRSGAMKRVMKSFEGRYGPLVPMQFEKYEAAGYRLMRSQLILKEHA